MEAVEFFTFANNGIIEIPDEYRKDYTNKIRVILIKNNSKQDIKEPDIQERIAAVERLVGIAANSAMSLEDIKSERLTRQSS